MRSSLDKHLLDSSSIIKVKEQHNQRGRVESESATTTCSSSTTATVPEPLPLHLALRDFAIDAVMGNRQDLEAEIIRLVDQSPDAVRVFDENGLLPLHIACKADIPYRVIERLVMSWPEAVSVQSRDKRHYLPLHVLCRYYAGTNGDRAKALYLLLRSHPEASRIATPSGELALHLLCQNYFCTTANLELLHKYYPDAVSKPSRKRQNLPIHIACEKQYMVRESRPRRGVVEDEPCSSSDEIIRFLARRFPDSLTIANSKGELPFLTAVRGYQSMETLRFLLQAYPDALQQADVNGRTALHIAISRHEPCRLTIKSLMEADPSALEVVDRDGRSPQHYAERHTAPWVSNMVMAMSDSIGEGEVASSVAEQRTRTM